MTTDVIVSEARVNVLCTTSHECACARVLSQAHIYMHTHAQAYTCIQTRADARTHTRIIHTQTQINAREGRDKETETNRDRQADRQRAHTRAHVFSRKHRETQRDRQAFTHTRIHKQRERERERGRHAGSQAGRKTDWDTQRERERERERERKEISRRYSNDTERGERQMNLRSSLLRCCA